MLIVTITQYLNSTNWWGISNVLAGSGHLSNYHYFIKGKLTNLI